MALTIISDKGFYDMKCSITIFFCTLIWSMVSYAIPVVNVVYRVDDRPISELAQTGMLPWVDGIADNDLAHHFDGEAIEGHTSNFVSTAMSLGAAVDHAASLARPNSEEPFDIGFSTYIYEIRPGNNFYPVDESFQAAMNASTPGSQRYNRLQSLLSDYGNMEDMVAQNGFGADRIIRYAELTGEMLEQYYSSGQMNSPMFWESRWTTEGTIYNTAYDNDSSSNTPWTIIDTPRGYADVVMNGTQPEVPLAATCLAIPPDTSVTLKKKESIRTNESNSCSPHEYVNIGRHFYDRNMLAAAIDN